MWIDLSKVKSNAGLRRNVILRRLLSSECDEFEVLESVKGFSGRVRVLCASGFAVVRFDLAGLDCIGYKKCGI
jgi:hypothetical protein